MANQIALLSRPLQNEGEIKFSFEDRVLEGVMVDQQTICVRDLPAFYACGASLMYKLDEVNSQRGSQEKRFT